MEPYVSYHLGRNAAGREKAPPEWSIIYGGVH